MKGDCISFEERIIYANEVVVPPPELLHYLSTDPDSNVKAYITTHEVAAGATNEVIAVDEDANTTMTFIWDTAGVGSNSLSIKSNGATDARSVMPLRIISGRLTTLTVSSVGSSPVDMGIARIVISDTTNTVYIEESI